MKICFKKNNSSNKIISEFTASIDKKSSGYYLIILPLSIAIPTQNDSFWKLVNADGTLIFDALFESNLHDIVGIPSGNAIRNENVVQENLSIWYLDAILCTFITEPISETTTNDELSCQVRFAHNVFDAIIDSRYKDFELIKINGRWSSWLNSPFCSTYLCLDYKKREIWFLCDNYCEV